MSINYRQSTWDLLLIEAVFGQYAELSFLCVVIYNVPSVLHCNLKIIMKYRDSFSTPVRYSLSRIYFLKEKASSICPVTDEPSSCVFLWRSAVAPLLHNVIMNHHHQVWPKLVGRPSGWIWMLHAVIRLRGLMLNSVTRRRSQLCLLIQKRLETAR